MPTNDDAGRMADPAAAPVDDLLSRELTARALDVLDRHLDRLGHSQETGLRQLGGLHERLLDALSAMSRTDDSEQRLVVEEIRTLRGTVQRLEEDRSVCVRALQEKEELSASLAERCSGLLSRLEQAEGERDFLRERFREVQTKLADAVERLAAVDAARADASRREQGLRMEYDALERRMRHMQESWERMTGSPASSTT